MALKEETNNAMFIFKTSIECEETTHSKPLIVSQTLGTECASKLKHQLAQVIHNHTRLGGETLQ